MKTTLLSILAFFFAATLNAQCKADSVITYRSFNGANQIASVEYFDYDQNDSLIKSTMVDFQDGKATPVYETTIQYSKKGGMNRVILTSSNWVADRGVFKPVSITRKSYSKKGNLLMVSSYNITNEDTVLFSEQIHSYDKNNNETFNILYYSNPKTGKYEEHTRNKYQYNSENKMTESFTEKWDTITQDWMGEWRIIFKYDSAGTLSNTTTYHFKNEAWIPTERTIYGKETDKPVEWNIVQKWDCGAEKWSNELYYVFQKNAKGQTDTEVHLSWIKKEWQIDMAYHYVYNEQGYLVQILNDQKLIMVDRFCRTR